MIEKHILFSIKIVFILRYLIKNLAFYIKMSYFDTKDHTMKNKKTLLDKSASRIKRRKDNVFILRDFDDLVAEYDYDQMLRALRMLVKDGTLVKIGYGIYAKTRTFNNGVVLPNAPIGDLAEEALQKLGIKTDKSSYWHEYNAGLSTQMPTGRVIAVNKRVRRHIEYNGFDIFFEKLKSEI